MKFEVLTNVNMLYSVEADSGEQALEKVLSGTIEPIQTEVLTDEVLK